MTAQVHDYIILDKSEYTISNYKLDDDAVLFSPKGYGFSPVMMSTACYRGYYCKFKVRYRRLYLDELTIRNAKGVAYPTLNDVEPQFNKEALRAVYSNLKMPMPVSGTLQVTKDFMRERYRHMGYQEIVSYRTVKELYFKDGRLVTSVDKSAEVERLRQTQDSIKTFMKHNWLTSEWQNRLQEQYGFIDNDIDHTFLQELKPLDDKGIHTVMAEILRLQPTPRWFLVNYDDYYERAHSYHFTFQFLAYLGCPVSVIRKLEGLITSANTESQVVVAFLEMLRNSLAGDLWGETLNIITGKQYVKAMVPAGLESTVAALFASTTLDAWPGWPFGE